MFEQSLTSSSRKNRHIRGLIQRPEFVIPRLRVLVDEIFYTTQDGVFNVRLLSSRIEQDRDLSNQLLEICSKPYYVGKTPIRTVTQCIQRLGPDGFRSTALQAYLELEIYPSQTWKKVMQELQTYSLIVAHIAKVLSRYTNIDRNIAFQAGLLHRIGITMGLKILSGETFNPRLFRATLTEDQADQYGGEPLFNDDTEIRNLSASLKPEAPSKNTPIPLSDSVEDIWETLEVSHPLIGGMVMETWGMDPELQRFVAHYGQSTIDRKGHPLGALIIYAEHLAQRFGFQISGIRRKIKGPKRTNRDQLAEESEQANVILALEPDNITEAVAEIRNVLIDGLRLNVRM